MSLYPFKNCVDLIFLVVQFREAFSEVSFFLGFAVDVLCNFVFSVLFESLEHIFDIHIYHVVSVSVTSYRVLVLSKLRKLLSLIHFAFFWLIFSRHSART